MTCGFGIKRSVLRIRTWQRDSPCMISMSQTEIRWDCLLQRSPPRQGRNIPLRQHCVRQGSGSVSCRRPPRGSIMRATAYRSALERMLIFSEMPRECGGFRYRSRMPCGMPTCSAAPFCTPCVMPTSLGSFFFVLQSLRRQKHSFAVCILLGKAAFFSAAAGRQTCSHGRSVSAAFPAKRTCKKEKSVLK